MISKLTHISRQSRRFRLVHQLFRERTIRNAHACVFYWGMLPLSLLVWVLLPLYFLVMTVVVWPIAWMTGFRKVEPFFQIDNADAPAGGDFFECANRKVAPWRIIFPILGAVGLFLLSYWGFTNYFGVAVGIVVGLVVLGTVGFFLARSDVSFERICPRLEVEK